MTERLQVTVNIEQKDLRAFFIYTTWLKQIYTLPALLFSLGVGVALLANTRLYLGLLVLALNMVYFYGRLRLWRSFRQSAACQAQTAYDLELADGVLRVTVPGQAQPGCYSLAELSDIKDLAGHYFFYLAPFSAVILPKRMLRPEQLVQLSALLQKEYRQAYCRY